MNKRRIAAQFTFRSVSKKVVLLTKVLGAAAILIYIFADSFMDWRRNAIFTILLVALILFWDAWLHRTVTRPIQHINETARRMADLDFSQTCQLHTRDEFGSIAESMNQMANNLQSALAQRKELTDTLSHELKTPLGIIRAYAEGL